MGLVDRKTSNKTFNGSKLNVPGQGISTSKIQVPNKLEIKTTKIKGNN